MPLAKNATLSKSKTKKSGDKKFAARTSTEIIHNKIEPLNQLDNFYNFLTNGEIEPDRR